MKLFKLTILFFLFFGLFPDQRVYAANNLDPGFVALSGSAAQNFKLAFGYRLIKERKLENYELVSQRYQFYFGDVPVYGGELTILEDSKGVVQNVIGYDASKTIITPINFRNITANDAAAIVNAKIGSGGHKKIDAMIDPKTGRYLFRVETRRPDSRWFYLIDADTGHVIDHYNGLTTGSGTGVLGDLRDLTGLTTLNGGQYQMVSTVVSGDNILKAYDALNNGILSVPVATDANDIWDTSGSTSPGQPALVDAQFYANVTNDYYSSVHNYRWIDDYTKGINSFVHYKRRYNNAFWDGSEMVYGDGDGKSFKNFSGDLDVVGHELSHGVTEAFSNLIYQNESGALNEAFSDIMGTAIEYYNNTGNWTIGEDITLADYSTCDPAGVNTPGIRSLANPPAFCDPSHYADRYTGTSDNGGVHTNSSIVNHWFYLLVNGGQNADPDRASGTNVTGIGLASAERIAFVGFTSLTSTANFCAARASTMAVAGGAASNVGDAWDEVGVDSALCSSGGGGGSSSCAVTITSPITDMSASKGGGVTLLGGPKFTLSWTTDIGSDSVVVFDFDGVARTYSSLVTNHSITFTGTNGAHYTGHVQSNAPGCSSSAPKNFDFINN